MKYKEGDRVRIRSKEWYESNKNKFGKVWTRSLTGYYMICFDHDFVKYCGKVAEIFSVERDKYALKGIPYAWAEEMIEGLVEEETKPEPKFKVGDKVKWFNHTCNITSIGTDENTYIYLIKHDDYREDKTFAEWVPESELTFEDDEETKPMTYEDTVEIIETMQGIGDSWECPQGYQFVDENGNVINAQKIVLEKKKKKYPKTYEECLVITPYDKEERILYLLEKFKQLLICRNAYWKIAGDEMGIGEPWEPNWCNNNTKYCISYSPVCRRICKTHFDSVKNNLAFPTEEMRDAFYDNFEELIKQCKELL